MVARLEAWTLWAGLTGGVSYYVSRADQGDSIFRGSDGDSVTVQLGETDVRLRHQGFEARAEAAVVSIGGARRLNRGLQSLSTEPIDPVASLLFGAYVEGGYNLLRPAKLRSGVQLVAFGRYEFVDTQLQMPMGYSRTLGNQRHILTLGLTFRPIAEVALKFDYQHFWTDSDKTADANIDSYNAGLAFMF